MGHPLTDLAYRVGLRGAYRGMRLYWQLRHPQTHGALVLIWCRGEVLLVRNSYIPYHSAPGGYVRKHETGRQAAARELGEEMDLQVTPDQLVLALDVHHDWEGKREHCEIFELEVAERPSFKVDHREVIAAGFFTPARALTLPLFPPLRDAIAKHSA